MSKANRSEIFGVTSFSKRQPDLLRCITTAACDDVSGPQVSGVFLEGSSAMAGGFVEVNLDGLVGPSHHYAGLAFGNEASMKHRAQPSHPRQAALQGLDKAWQVARQGIPQGILPPQNRPRLDWLSELGWQGSAAEILSTVSREAPRLLSAAYSASSMWAANAATVSPSIDTRDSKVHLTPANLHSGLHRSLEAEETYHLFDTIFPPSHFKVHPPLPAGLDFRDEGAANHTRFAPQQGRPGIHLFVFGADTLAPNAPGTQRYPSRQTRLASETIIRRHGLDPQQCVLAQQNPQAIDAGVFHNDVIAVGHENLFLVHQMAFEDQATVLSELRNKYRATHDSEIDVAEINSTELPLADAVSSYLFNSQILTDTEGHRTILSPTECEQISSAAECLSRRVGPEAPFQIVRYVDLRESMNNGGGPACLRLRLPLSTEERLAVHAGVWLTEQRYQNLRSIIESHYPAEITFEDLADVKLMKECQAARQAILEAMDLQHLPF
jgi:succinylarginine dihydrolase